MKHTSARAFFAYWDDKRGDAAAPDRANFEPDGVRNLLGDIFVLSCSSADGYPFRVAGTRVCALLGYDAKGQRLVDLFCADSREELQQVLGFVAEELLPIIAGVTATGANGRHINLELLLLPFNARAHTPLSMTGLLVPLQPLTGPASLFDLVSWRVIAPRPHRRTGGPRRRKLANGLVVYETSDW